MNMNCVLASKRDKKKKTQYGFPSDMSVDISGNVGERDVYAIFHLKEEPRNLEWPWDTEIFSLRSAHLAGQRLSR